MSVRLNKNIREQTIKTAVRVKFDDGVETARSNIKEYASTFTSRTYPPEIQEWVNKAPVGALDCKGGIYFKELHKNGKDTVGISAVSVELFHVLSCDRYGLMEVVISKEESKKLTTLEKELATILQQRTEFESLIKGAIYGCNTVEQLHEHYPDIAKHLPKMESSNKQLAVTSKNVAEAFKAKVPKG